MRYKNWPLVLNGLLLAGILVYSICRDMQSREGFPGDLQNRIMGARMQLEEKLPYTHSPDGTYFSFKKGVNPYRGNEQPSYVTASPFFHQLLYPICHWSVEAVYPIWKWIEYLLLAGLLWMACGLTTEASKRILIVNAGILFTLTEAWEMLIRQGQLYFFIAFLVGGLMAGLLRGKTSSIVLAAICAVMLVLIRPIILVAGLPLLFHGKKLRLFAAVVVSGLMLYAFFVMSSSYEKALWKNYYLGVSANISMHQAEEVKVLSGNPIPVKSMPVAGLGSSNPVLLPFETGNVFVFYRLLFKKKMPLKLLHALSLLTVTAVLLLYAYFFRKNRLKLSQALLCGFVLYLIVEIDSPIYRFQYYTVQWLPLVLTGMVLVPGWKNLSMFLLILGLSLNISNTHLIPMRHTLGEFIWMGTLLFLAFSRRVNPIPWKPQLSPAGIPASAGLRRKEGETDQSLKP